MNCMTRSTNRLFAILLLTAACSKAPANSTAAQSTQGAESSGAMACSMPEKCQCPMAVPGAQVGYEDTTDGAAMVFTTQPESVAELQKRVAHMAERHGSKRAEEHKHAIPHSARAENTEQGARLVMVPDDPSQLDALRAHVRERVQKVQAGECPMHEHSESHGHHGHHHEEAGQAQ